MKEGTVYPDWTNMHFKEAVRHDQQGMESECKFYI